MAIVTRSREKQRSEARQPFKKRVATLPPAQKQAALEQQQSAARATESTGSAALPEVETAIIEEQQFAAKQVGETAEVRAEIAKAKAEYDADLAAWNAELDNYVKLATGEYMAKTDFNTLSAEDQALIMEVGIDAFNSQKQTQFENENVKLNYVDPTTGEPQYIPRAIWESLGKSDPGGSGPSTEVTEDQQKLMDLGVEGYNAWKRGIVDNALNTLGMTEAQAEQGVNIFDVIHAQMVQMSATDTRYQTYQAEHQSRVDAAGAEYKNTIDSLQAQLDKGEITIAQYRQYEEVAANQRTTAEAASYETLKAQNAAWTEEAYKTLSTGEKAQAMMTLGVTQQEIDQAIASLGGGVTRLDTGEYVDSASYVTMPPLASAYLNEIGVEAYKNYVDSVLAKYLNSDGTLNVETIGNVGTEEKDKLLKAGIPQATFDYAQAMRSPSGTDMTGWINPRTGQPLTASEAESYAKLGNMDILTAAGQQSINAQDLVNLGVTPNLEEAILFMDGARALQGRTVEEAIRSGFLSREEAIALEMDVAAYDEAVKNYAALDKIAGYKTVGADGQSEYDLYNIIKDNALTPGEIVDIFGSDKPTGCVMPDGQRIEQEEWNTFDPSVQTHLIKDLGARPTYNADLIKVIQDVRDGKIKALAQKYRAGSIMAASIARSYLDWTVPVYGTVRHWGEMGKGGKLFLVAGPEVSGVFHQALSVIGDVLFFAPVLGKAGMAARNVTLAKEGLRAATTARLGAAFKAGGSELVYQIAWAPHLLESGINIAAKGLRGAQHGLYGTEVGGRFIGDVVDPKTGNILQVAEGGTHPIYGGTISRRVRIILTDDKGRVLLGSDRMEPVDYMHVIGGHIPDPNMSDARFLQLTGHARSAPGISIEDAARIQLETEFGIRVDDIRRLPNHYGRINPHSLDGMYMVEARVHSFDDIDTLKHLQKGKQAEIKDWTAWDGHTEVKGNPVSKQILADYNDYRKMGWDLSDFKIHEQTPKELLLANVLDDSWGQRLISGEVFGSSPATQGAANVILGGGSGTATQAGRVGSALTGRVKGIYGSLENLINPWKLPESVVSNASHTIKIKLSAFADKATALQARQQLMDILKNNKESVVLETPDNIIVFRRSRLMRETGGLAHATPQGEKFIAGTVVKWKNGMPLMEQGVFFSPEPLWGFGIQAAHGGIGEMPTIYIASSKWVEENTEVLKKIFWNKGNPRVEAEAIAGVGTEIPKAKQHLFTRMGYTGQRVEILLQEPLTTLQIAKLKALGLVEQVQNLYSPVIYVEPWVRVIKTAEGKEIIFSSRLMDSLAGAVPDQYVVRLATADELAKMKRLQSGGWAGRGEIVVPSKRAAADLYVMQHEALHARLSLLPSAEKELLLEQFAKLIPQEVQGKAFKMMTSTKTYKGSNRLALLEEMVAYFHEPWLNRSKRLELFDVDLGPMPKKLDAFYKKNFTAPMTSQMKDVFWNRLENWFPELRKFKRSNLWALSKEELDEVANIIETADPEIARNLRAVAADPVGVGGLSQTMFSPEVYQAQTIVDPDGSARVQVVELEQAPGETTLEYLRRADTEGTATPYITEQRIEPPYASEGYTAQPYTEVPYGEVGYAETPYVPAPYTTQPYMESTYTDVPYVPPPRVDVPYVPPPRVDVPYVPPPRVDVPYVPPPRVDVPYVPPPRVDVPYVPPPRIPVLILPPGSSKESLTRQELEASVTWRQGLFWILRYPPYRLPEDLVYLKQSPTGAKVVEGPESAYLSIQKITARGGEYLGEVGQMEPYEMGFERVGVQGGMPKLGFELIPEKTVPKKTKRKRRKTKGRKQPTTEVMR